MPHLYLRDFEPRSGAPQFDITLGQSAIMAAMKASIKGKKDFLSLPQEILNNIYEHFFEDIRISPTFKLPKSPGSHDSSSTQLLRLCKPQYSATRTALWKKATVVLDTDEKVVALVDHFTDCDHIRHVDIGSVDSARPFLLFSRLLRQLQNLELVHVSALAPDRLAHNLDDDRPELRTLMRDVIFERTYNRVPLRTSRGTLLYDILRAVTRLREGLVPRVIVSFVGDACTDSSDSELDDDLSPDLTLESFDSATWTISIAHAGHSYSIPQKPLDELVGDTKGKSNSARGNLFEDNRVCEDPLWSFIARLQETKELEPTPDLKARLYRHATTRDVRAFSNTRTLFWWSIACTYYEWLRPGHHDRYYLSMEEQYKVWKAILAVEDERLLARPWKDVYRMIMVGIGAEEDIDSEAGEVMCYTRQCGFFQKLFDIERPWLEE